MKSNLIAVATAAAIAMIAVVPAANAAPFAAPPATAIITDAEGTISVGRRHRHHNCHGCGAAAVGIGAFALGLAIASQSQAATVVRECSIERTRHWSPRLQAYVIRKEKVCY